MVKKLRVNEAKEWTEQDRQEAIRNITSNPTYKKISNICDKYGYKMPKYLNIRDYGSFYSLSEEFFHPVDSDSFKEVVQVTNQEGALTYGEQFTVKAQTTAYGSLDYVDFLEFQRDLEDTANFMSELMEVDFNNLYHMEV